MVLIRSLRGQSPSARDLPLQSWDLKSLLDARRARRYKADMSLESTVAIRVRYPEVDAMGYLHHSRYLQYFEIGRVELLREQGFAYADLERAGVFFVVVKVEVRYRNPARYDEELTLITRLVKQTTVRLDHAYELRRGATLLAEGATTIACVDRGGQLQPIPEYLSLPLDR